MHLRTDSPPRPAGEHAGDSSFSLAMAAEEIVRASPGASIDWQGVSLASHFQPIFNVRRRKCHGFEALVRAVDDEGAVPWEELLARTTMRARVLLDWTCRAMHLRNYARIDPGDCTLCLNVLPEAAARDAGREKEFANLIRYYGLVPKRVCAEILPAACSSEAKLREAVDGYRELGITIAMGAFGTESSNLDRVVALRPDLVKVDFAALAAAMGNERARRVLPGMVSLLREAHVKIAVAGLETRTDAALAVALKADFVQGFFFASPLAALAADAAGEQRLEELT